MVKLSRRVVMAERRMASPTRSSARQTKTLRFLMNRFVGVSGPRSRSGMSDIGFVIKPAESLRSRSLKECL